MTTTTMAPSKMIGVKAKPVIRRSSSTAPGTRSNATRSAKTTPCRAKTPARRRMKKVRFSAPLKRSHTARKEKTAIIDDWRKIRVSIEVNAGQKSQKASQITGLGSAKRTMFLRPENLATPQTIKPKPVLRKRLLMPIASQSRPCRSRKGAVAAPAAMPRNPAAHQIIEASPSLRHSARIASATTKAMPARTR